MTESTHARIPEHLRKYVVDQNYERYSSEDQAVWRFIMRQLRSYLSLHAHPSYLPGLEKTGISTECIPRIEEVDAHLEQMGWGAVPVSGFIPPAAFMEFQSLGILPIASDMRTVEHLLYTPAPDIVHEAAGHAPILSDPEYAAYLLKYGEVARHAILSKQDLDQYEAIRILSDIKEDPRSTPEEIRKAERRLNEVNAEMKEVSEAALLSRMNWWTAEYGLVGKVSDPKIFGAGLLSSVGEARSCLRPQVKKIPLSVDCVDYSYDITEPQPQLFVSENFAHLSDVLEQLAARLSYRSGGAFGLTTAKRAGTVVTVQLNSAVQASGVLSDFMEDGGSPIYFKLVGPSQLAFQYKELTGQGVKRHSHGFSSPVGRVKAMNRCLSEASVSDLEKIGLRVGHRARLEFTSGVLVEGVVKSHIFESSKLLVVTWADCRVTLGQQVLFDPAWGEFDMAVGSEVSSVFGGPADRSRYGQTDDFVAQRVPAKTYSPDRVAAHSLYNKLRECREKSANLPELKKLISSYLKAKDPDWLAGVELLELCHKHGLSDEERKPILERLDLTKDSVRDGVELAAKVP